MTRVQFDGPPPIVYSLWQVEVKVAHTSGMGQSLQFQDHVPFTPGDGDFPPQRLLSAFVVRFLIPKDPTVARKKAPSLVGIGGDQGKSTSYKLGNT